MRDNLRLNFNSDTDGTGKLFAQVNAKGFSGASSAWFGTDQVVEFAQQLAEAYPLQAEHPLKLEGGFWSKSGAVVEQLHFELKLYPVGSVGLVGCRVSLITPIHSHERLNSQSLVAVELTVYYEQLRSFARSLEELAKGGVHEVVLELTLFHGHLIVVKQAVQDAPSQSAISSAMEPADDRFSRHWAQAQRASA